ncbi:hypothetical protein [Bacillus kwashiorkori]|uniref:hypothetical protein n=1 Tax=Bacillus kwashiorkori TaxID=1522318 RepID=UPI0007801F7C|nr:hypothetical protein [Bacillus kwashiorkori]
MPFALTLCLTLLILYSFIFTKKYIHPLEISFLLLLLVLSYTSLMSILYVNLDLWEIRKDNYARVAFELNSILYVPLTIITFVNLLEKQKWKLTRLIGYSILTLFFLFIGEQILKHTKVFQHNNFPLHHLLLVWIALFIISVIAKKLFRKLLFREGIIK